MKDQASLNLLIVDSPIDTKALENHLMLRATSTGLKVYDANGSEQELGGGGEIDWSNVSASTINLSTTTGELKLMGASSMTLELPASNSKIHFEGASLNLFATDLNFNGSALNTAEGLVQLDESGRLPAVDGSQLTNLPAATVDLSNYSAATIKLIGTSTFTASGAMTTDIGSTTGVTNIIGNTVRLHGTYGTTVGEAGELNLGGSSKNSLQPATQITVNVTDPANKLLLNDAKPNAANGFALVGSDGKLPASILPESSGGSVDLSSYVGGIGLTSSDDVPVVIAFNSGNPTYNANLTMNSAGVTLAGYGDVSVEHTGGAYLRLSSSEVALSSEGTLTLSSTSRLTINATDGIFLGAAGLNTAGGLVKLGDDGKIPSSLYEAGSGGDTSALEERVTTLEGTVGTLDAAVDEILADYGEGSGALVYRVVASATEPENPTEGMIWIQTE